MSVYEVIHGDWDNMYKSIIKVDDTIIEDGESKHDFMIAVEKIKENLHPYTWSQVKEIRRYRGDCVVLGGE